MKKVLTFLSALEKNNNKAWFDLHRADYEAAKQDHLDFVDELIQGIVKFDPSIGMPLAKECLFRINRDVRFSNNKAPYKNNMGACLRRAARNLRDLAIIFMFNRVPHF